jgi:hypothetical protein
LERYAKATSIVADQAARHLPARATRDRKEDVRDILEHYREKWPSLAVVDEFVR